MTNISERTQIPLIYLKEKKKFTCLQVHNLLYTWILWQLIIRVYGSFEKYRSTLVNYQKHDKHFWCFAVNITNMFFYQYVLHKFPTCLKCHAFETFCVCFLHLPQVISIIENKTSRLFIMIYQQGIYNPKIKMHSHNMVTIRDLGLLCNFLHLVHVY